MMDISSILDMNCLCFGEGNTFHFHFFDFGVKAFELGRLTFYYGKNAHFQELDFFLLRVTNSFTTF